MGKGITDRRRPLAQGLSLSNIHSSEASKERTGGLVLVGGITQNKAVTNDVFLFSFSIPSSSCSSLFFFVFLFFVFVLLLILFLLCYLFMIFDYRRNR